MTRLTRWTLTFVLLALTPPCAAPAGAGDLVLGDGGIVFPDGTVQTTAGGRRAFYLTPSRFSGANALTACDPGFHMASIWELVSLGGLQYDSARGSTTEDSGEGPPVFAGWVRTGTSAAPNDSLRLANCNAWTTNASTATGTVAGLAEDEGSRTVPGTAWVLQSPSCAGLRNVWCIAD